MSSSNVGMQGGSKITPSQKFEGHTDWVTGAIHLPDGQRMMTCSGDSLRVWDLKSGKQIGHDWRDGDNQVWTIALSPDGKKVVSGGCVDGAVKLWDIDTGKVIAKWMEHTEKVVSVCWSRDGRRVVTGSLDGTAREWDAEKGKTILGLIETGHQQVHAVICSPDMTMFATGGCDKWTPGTLAQLVYTVREEPVRIWDAKTGKLVATLKGHTLCVNQLAWTPDGKILISASTDGLIKTWNTSNWKQIAVMGHTDIINDIAISPNGRILASASNDNTAQLWNLDNGQPIGSPLHHTLYVLCVSFASDGRLLATGCFNDNAYTWDVSAILQEAGLNDLLLDKRNKSLLATDATRRPVRQPIKVLNQVPRGFFDDIPDRAHLSAQYRTHSLPPPSFGHTLRSRLSSLFRPMHPDTRHTPSRPRPFHWIRNRLSARRSAAHIELHERPPAVVDVPLCQAKPRNASAREKRRPIPRPIRKNPTASSSRPPNSTVTQQSSGAAQTQSSLQPHATVSTSTAPPVVANATLNANPHATIKHAGRWTRFWLLICCTSPEYTDGHH